MRYSSPSLPTPALSEKPTFSNDEPEIILRFALQNISQTDMPARFRTMLDHLADHNMMRGLEKCNASGSGEFFAEDLLPLIAALRKAGNEGEHSSIAIVDLRRESHCFVNGWPYFWYARPQGPDYVYDQYNAGKTAQEIEKDELVRIQKLLSDGIVTAYYPVEGETTVSPMDITRQKQFMVQRAVTEKHIVEKHGLHYCRLPIVDRHAPTVQEVDDVLNFFKNNQFSWLHFHCNAGKGRTTTALFMLDAFHNAKDVDFEILVQRQYLLGGIDLAMTEQLTPWETEWYKENLATCKNFYRYCVENTDAYETSYSAWLKNQSKNSA